MYREEDKIILQTGGGGPSRGWAINADYTLWEWRQRGGNPKEFIRMGDDVDLLIRPASQDYNLDRCRSVSNSYEFPEDSDDFFFTYEYYDANLLPATDEEEEEEVTENSDSHISSYAGLNWQQDSPNPNSVTNTDSRVINSICPICQEEFTNEQNIDKFRCGHAVCASCLGKLNEHAMRRCSPLPGQRPDVSDALP